MRSFALLFQGGRLLSLKSPQVSPRIMEFEVTFDPDRIQAVVSVRWTAAATLDRRAQKRERKSAEEDRTE
jgi:hypothetical protein